MTTEDYLTSKNVTMEEARDFLLNNYESSLEAVYNICKEYGVNNDMIADILQDNFPGLNGAGVAGFFDAYGLSGNELGFNTSEDLPDTPDVTGTLDLGNLFSYGTIQLYQNVSQEFVDTIPDVLSFLQGDYAYASSDTWDSIQDLGFSDNYSSLTAGQEAAFTDDYSTTAVGYDLTFAEVGSPYGVSASVGPYDLIIGL